ncbi:MAG: toxin-antitoxin system protein [Candidatus Hydrogenedentes bacterium]|nr:toxin-antitoxin system protein [Candidatus Hydrogenedentota bacterium]
MRMQSVSISEADHTALSDMAKQTGRSLTSLLAEAIRELQRRHLLNQTNTAFARLKQDSAAWEEEKRERALWDHSLADGV